MSVELKVSLHKAMARHHTAVRRSSEEALVQGMKQLKYSIFTAFVFAGLFLFVSRPPLAPKPIATPRS